VAVQVTANPTSLAWSNYTPTDDQPTDDDGNSVDAFTKFAFEIPVIRAHWVTQKVGFDRSKTGKLVSFDMNGAYTLKITPSGLKVWKKIQQTADLLSHEQLHYDIGVIAAQELIKDLAALSAPSMAELGKAFNAAVDLHFKTRSKAVNVQYDDETKHGADAKKQKIWKDAMTACLNGTSTTIMGLPL